MQRRGYREALAHQDFRRLTLALIVNSAGTWAYGVVLLVYLYDRTHSTAWVAASTVVRYVPSLVLSVYAGVLAERFERRTVLICSTVSAGIAMSAMAVCVATGAPVVSIVALALVTSALGTPFNPAVAALVPQLVGERDLVAANSVQATIENVAIIAGPALGAALLLTGEPTSAFALNAASFFVAALILSRVTARSRPTDVTEHGAGLIAQMSVGFRALFQAPAAFAPVLFSVLATFIYGTDTVLYVPISRHLHASNGYGYLLAAEAVGGVLAAGLVNRMAGRKGLALFIAGGMALYCLPTAILPALHSLGPAIVIPLVRGVGTLVVDVLALTALQRAVRPELLSRVFGVYTALLLAAAALGAMVVPPLLSGVGLTTTLFLVAFVPTAASLLGVPTLRRIDAEAAARVARLAPIVDMLSRMDLFENADQPVLERLASSAETMHPVAGDVLVREGERADALYVVVRGEVTVSASGEAGTPREIRTLGPGTYFGEIGLLHGIARTATVRAASAGEVYRIGADDFRAALSTSEASGTLLTTAGSRLACTHPLLAGTAAAGAARS